MKPYEIMRHIRALSLPVAPDEKPFDDSGMNRHVSYGDPEKEVRTVAVAMESTPRALREAHRLGCELFIAHHQTFGYGSDSPFEDCKSDPFSALKKAVLDESGMTLLRVHESWDLVPEIGVFDTWIRLLGFEHCPWEPCQPVPKWEPWIRRAVFMKKLTIPPVRFGELSHHIAEVVAPYGQNGVLVTGDADTRVRTLGVGVGGITDVRSYYDSGCDAGIITSLSENYWADTVGFPLIYVDHIVSELQGLKNLADYLTATLPEITVHYIDNGCLFKVVTAADDGRSKPSAMAQA
ncbi:MAG TPA: Nif3-like dinuclear metal center hexameric protein [Verrucomicrobiae bacterium]|nr:Nif3-like dinuclear metal center hexameric protein [Verrucomicrobiae bacterium]